MRRDYKNKVLAKYDLFPFHNHPYWIGVMEGRFSLPQILRAERQHYLRTKAGQSLRKQSAQFAPSRSPRIFEAALSNYIEEVAPDARQPSHLELIERLLAIGGVTKYQLARTRLTPGNTAAIALYKDIADRGTACHLVGAGSVEFYYSELSPRIFEAYTNIYGMTAEQAETYKIHGPVDKIHAERALDVLDEAIDIHGWTLIEKSVEDAFTATSLHYDGMYQAATGSNEFWNGEQT